MSIKVELKEPAVTKFEVTFPSLYRSVNDRNLVILFVSETSGLVLSKDHDFFSSLGDFCESLMPCFNAHIWEKLPVGTQIILTQK